MSTWVWVEVWVWVCVWLCLCARRCECAMQRIELGLQAACNCNFTYIYLHKEHSHTHTHTPMNFVVNWNNKEKMIWLPECRVSNRLKQPNSSREPPHLIHIKTKGYRQCRILPRPPPHSFLIRGSLLRASYRLAALFVQFVVRLCHFVLPQWTQTLRPEGKSIRNTCS